MIVVYYLFVVLAWFIAVLPFRVVYIISDFFCFVLYRIIGYRKKVVYNNIQRSFPEKTDEEVKQIMNKFYHHLCDVFMEVLKLLTMTGEQKLKRIKYKNPEVLKELFDANKSVICVVGHYGNWEWNGPHILGKVSNYEIYSVVKRLTDKRFEKFLTYIRNKDGGNLIPITQTLRNMIKHRNELTMTIMASDQCPMESEVEYWTKFLNQETPVFLGAEKIAKKLDYCVVFLKIKKVKRGFYEVDVIKITDTPKLTEDLEITEKHVRLLENAIIEQPELWLWSHKRWKYNRKQIKTSITQIYNKNLNS